LASHILGCGAEEDLDGCQDNSDTKEDKKLKAQKRTVEGKGL
jgi:hypothetical protein